MPWKQRVRNRQAILHDEMDCLAAGTITLLEKTLADESNHPALRVKVVQGVNRVSAQKPLLPRSTAENAEIENFLRTMEMRSLQRPDKTILPAARHHRSSEQAASQPNLSPAIARVPAPTGSIQAMPRNPRTASSGERTTKREFRA
jgi:hypothetical protein